MDRTMKRRTAVLAAFGVFGVITVVSVTPALAAFPEDSVKLYTGCLGSGGNINYVKEGDSPSQPCSSPKQVVRFSGGDITRVTVTGALTGGGANGAVTIGLDPGKTVPASCASGQVPKWTTSGIPAVWACGNDNDTTYSAGTGLDLTGTTFSVRPDAFTAGTGLSRSGTTFNVLPDAFTKKNQACVDGTFATGSDRSGTLVCGTPTSALPIFHTVKGGADFDTTAPRSEATPAQLSLEAGTWAITVDARNLSQADGGHFWNCLLEGVTPTEGDVEAWDSSVGFGDRTAATAFGKVTLDAAATLPVTCVGFNSSTFVRVSALQVQ